LLHLLHQLLLLLHQLLSELSQYLLVLQQLLNRYLLVQMMNQHRFQQLLLFQQQML
jgi:hypothetical protein